MAVKKNVKTGNNENPKTKCQFGLILTRWARMYAYFVHLTKNDRLNIAVVILLLNKGCKGENDQ